MRIKLGVTVLLLAMGLGLVSTGGRTPSGVASPSGVVSGVAAPPEILFEANGGQADPAVRFLARGPGYRMFLTRTETVLALSPTTPGGVGATVRLSAGGGNPAPIVEGVERAAATVNHLRAGTAISAATFGKVAVRDLYPGIDAVYYGTDGQLEYDYVLAPGADPSTIRLDIAGADGVALDAGGNLLLTTGAGTVTQRRPVAYQEVGGTRRPVEAAYVLADSATAQVGIRTGAYDRALPLVIDPVIVYSTYLGGSVGGLADDEGDAIAVDPAGNAYVTGRTAATDFPVAGAADTTLGGTDDAFVTKLSPTGALLWSTYFGGDGFDQGLGVAFDPVNGAVFATGLTTSDATSFPLAGAVFDGALGGGQDAFVARLSAATGALAWSTYLGGDDVDSGFAVAVDGAGNPVVTGQTFSATGFPVVNAFDTTFGDGAGISDAFLTRLPAGGGGLLASTFLGGSGDEAGQGVAVDSSGRAVVTGFTSSVDFPLANASDSTLGGSQDGFVTSLSGGALVYSTYLGGGGDDAGFGIDVEPGGTAHVTGQTSSGDFPTVGGADTTLSGSSDAFVSTVTAGSASPTLVASRFLGGAGDEAGFGISLGAGTVFVTGSTTSGDFPLLEAVDATFGGAEEAFVAQLALPGLAALYSTYLGGDDADAGFGIAAEGTAAHVTGFTSSATGFPLARPADATLGGVSDGFVTRIDLIQPTTTTVTSNPTVTFSPATQTVTLTAQVSPASGPPVDAGTVTFSVQGGAVGPDVTVPVGPTGLATATFTINAGAPIGTYVVVASYSGAPGFAPSTSSGAGNGTLTIAKASPTISTQASPDTVLGGAVRDVATVAGGVSPTGTVTFRLFSDPVCATEVFTSTNPLSGSTATSGWFVPAGAGTYRWTAVYNGDANNNPVASPCNAPNEAVTVRPFEPPPFTRTITGDLLGPVTVTSGESVLITSARVVGPVTVQPGGALTVVNSQISRGVTADAPRFLSVCGTQISGPAPGQALGVSNAPVPIRIGDPASGCAGNRFAGQVNLVANNAVVFGANTVSHNVTVNGGGPGGTVIKANTVFSALSCTGNNPPPTNAGQPNSAGSKSGQCAAV